MFSNWEPERSGLSQLEQRHMSEKCRIAKSSYAMVGVGLDSIAEFGQITGKFARPRWTHDAQHHASKVGAFLIVPHIAAT